MYAPSTLQTKIEFISHREHSSSTLDRPNGYLDICAVSFVEFYYICPTNAQYILTINRCC